MFDLKWYIAGKVQSVVMSNKSRALCYWEKKRVSSLYTQGKLVVVAS